MSENRCSNCENVIVDSGVKCAQCEEFYLCLQVNNPVLLQFLAT